MPDSPTASQQTSALKRRVGRSPFDQRLQFNNGYAACPFHNGDGDKSMHLVEKDGGWIATCFSSCQKSWDAVGFVMEFDKVEFGEALARLGGRATAVPPASDPRPKPKRITDAEWSLWGRELTLADIERLARSRKDKTASFETFKQFGCRVKGDHIGFPYRHTLGDDVVYDAIRLRHMDTKDFLVEHGASLHGMFNLDSVNPIEDVYVVEGEPDVAVMEDAGFRAVSVSTGAQKKFDPKAIKTLRQAPRVFLVGDQSNGSDDPGEKCMDALQKALNAPETTFRIRFAEAKDVSQLARQLGDSFAGRIEDLREDSLTPWVRKNLPTISQLSAEPVKWVVQDMFPYGGLSMLSSKAGGTKSLFALFLAKALSGGHNEFLGRKLLHDVRGFNVSASGINHGTFARKFPVLYVDRENPEGIVGERARAMGIVANRDFIYWGDWTEQTPELDDPRLMEFARRERGFIVFDSLQDWYPAGFNENDNTKIVELMGKFRRLARAGAGVLLLHHNAKYMEASRGGTAFVALTDMAFKSSKKEADPGVIELREDRFRACASWELDFRLHWKSGEEQFYQMEVLRDESASAAIKRAQGQQEEKASAKEAKDASDAERIAQEIDADRTSTPRTLEKRTGISRGRIERLAATRDLSWDDDTKEWKGGMEF